MAINTSLIPILSSSVNSYNGNAIGTVPLGSNPTLNSVLEAIGTEMAKFTPTTALTSNAITLSVACTGTGTLLGATLSSFFTDLTATLTAIDLTPYLAKSLYDANTILYATIDNTPVALIIGVSTFVGRKSSGGISAMSVAEVITELATMNKDADSVFPYNPALPLSVGAGTAIDKVLLVPKESGVWATNPYISWIHSAFLATGEALSVYGKAATKNYIQSVAIQEDSGLIASTTGINSTLKKQSCILTNGTDTWFLQQDGADSNKFKLIYYNGVAYTTIVSIDKATGYITFNGTTAILGVLNDATMVANSAVHTITQQSFLAYFAAHAAPVTEVDAIETGAGLDATGTYTADAGSNYITGAKSLKNADSLLDAAITTSNNKDLSSTITAEKRVKCAYGTFTFSQQPTTGVYTINLATIIPNKSIITYARVDVTTVFTDNGTNISTMGIGIENIGAGTADIKVAAQIGTAFTLGLKDEAWSTFKQASPFKLTTAKNITVNVVLGGTATTLSTGKLSIYVEYFTTE